MLLHADGVVGLRVAGWAGWWPGAQRGSWLQIGGGL